jgi:ABC-type transporter Mla subunit MlaD
LDRTVDQGQVQWHLGIMEAKDRWEKTREGASKALQILKEDQQKAEELFQELRLQAKLAKAETRDFLAENKQELNKNLKDISAQSVKALKRMNESIGDILHRLD